MSSPFTYFCAGLWVGAGVVALAWAVHRGSWGYGPLALLHEVVLHVRLLLWRRGPLPLGTTHARRIGTYDALCAEKGGSFVTYDAKAVDCPACQKVMVSP